MMINVVLQIMNTTNRSYNVYKMKDILGFRLPRSNSMIIYEVTNPPNTLLDIFPSFQNEYRFN